MDRALDASNRFTKIGRHAEGPAISSELAPDDLAQVEVSEAARREVVAGIYRALLLREAEPNGLKVHAAALAQAGGLAGLEKMLRGFVRGKEFRLRHGALVDTGGLFTPTTRPLSSMGQISHVLSLGTNCFSSQFLKKYDLKKFSGPFDWIFSSPQMVHHALGDDFVTLLDRTMHQTIPLDARQHPNLNRTDHAYYRQKYGIRNVFNHHDMNDDDFSYFQRCVYRFRSALQGPRRSVLLQCLRDHPDNHKAFSVTVRALTSYAPNAILNVFLFDETDSSLPVPRLEIVQAIGPHRLLRLTPVSQRRPLSFADPLDELAMLRALNQYDLQLLHAPI
jgi:hypothetical protein